MSRKATIRSPSATFVAGMSPAAIPQNKHSGTLTIIVAGQPRPAPLWATRAARRRIWHGRSHASALGTCAEVEEEGGNCGGTAGEHPGRGQRTAGDVVQKLPRRRKLLAGSHSGPLLCYRVDPNRRCANGTLYGYSCLSAILRRFLGWSYRMWVGHVVSYAEPGVRSRCRRLVTCGVMQSPLGRSSRGTLRCLPGGRASVSGRRRAPGDPVPGAGLREVRRSAKIAVAQKQDDSE